jgi:1,4-dihydroxy-2-naphthoate octaprenyltransferase
MPVSGVISFILVGLLCIVAAIKYTVGKKPYGYVGLGDIAVFLFFGIVGVCGIYYLHAHVLSLTVVLPAASLGLLSTGVLNINNIRDVESDRQSGKFTLVVRWGLRKAKIYHAMLVISAIGLGITATILDYHGLFQLLYVMTIPFFLKNIYKVHISKSPASLDKELKFLAMTTFFYAVFYCI